MSMNEPKHTGRECPACKKPAGMIEAVTPNEMVLRCPACGHLWKAAEPKEKQ